MNGISWHRRPNFWERLKRAWRRWTGAGRDVISLKERMRMTLATDHAETDPLYAAKRDDCYRRETR
jgi:hypothetical protein